ncbi:hypothetical protein [Paenibacillus polymyxa]|uniref:hypothetical protein n=1 Tax=Paenibacillus polymyxa TaxID=1406 RepID=UPI0020360DC2|nr:hypothetical protein [Paenibacillus polymyxa]
MERLVREKLLQQKYNKHLIVPMTIYKEENFNYIYNGLKEIDQDIHHFCFTATEETIYHRLAKRGDEYGGWQYQQASKCVEAFKDEQFQTRIITDHLETSEIIELILKKVLSK